MATQATPQSEPQAQSAPQQERRVTLELLNVITETELKQEYCREIVSAELSRDRFDQDWRLAKVFALSGIFSDLKDCTKDEAIATAMAKIQLGRSWGLSPADSMRFLYFTNGKPALETEIIAAKLKEKGYDWDIEWMEDPKSKRCIGCRLWLKKLDSRGIYSPVLDRDKKPISVAFTKDDADGAMIWENKQKIPLSQKWNFQSWPRDMYFARCISRVKKYHVTDVLTGATTKEDAEDMAQPTEEQRFDADKLAAVTERRLAEERAKAARVKPKPEPEPEPDPETGEIPMTEEEMQAEQAAALAREAEAEPERKPLAGFDNPFRGRR